MLSQGAHFHGIKTSYQIFLLFALLFTRKVSSLCSLHCYGCCSCQVMLMYPGWHPSTVTRIKLHAEGDCIQAWPQALVLVAAVVARLDGKIGWLLVVFILGYVWVVGFSQGGSQHAYIQPVLLHKSTNSIHLMSNTLSPVRS